jgi:hypothetical protein
VECRRKGTELVIRWDSDFKVRCLIEMQASTMAYLRDGAAKAMSCSEQTMCSEHMSEVIETWFPEVEEQLPGFNDK